MPHLPRPFSRCPRATLFAFLTLLGLTVVTFQGAVFGGSLYERDVHLIWHPQIEGFVRAVAGGGLPLWDPSPSFGQPLLADPGAQVLYPPTWLNLVLRPWHYYTLFAVGHVFGSGLAFFFLTRRWGVSATAAAGGAAAWAAGGPLLTLVTLWHHFAGASLIPVVWLAADRALARRRRRDVLWLGTALGVQVLAGSPDMCALTLLSLIAWVTTTAVRSSGLRDAKRLAAGALFALALAGALSAGQWIASLEILLRSGRAELPDVARTYWSMHPGSLLEILLPGIPSGLSLVPDARQALFDGREPFLASVYLGLPAAALAMAGLVAPFPWRLRLSLAVIFAAAVAIALGRHAPFYSAAAALLPPLSVLRYPIKAMIVASFAWSGLVALGIDRWRTVSTSAGWRLLGATPLLIGLAAAAAILSTPQLLVRAGLVFPDLPPLSPELARRLMSSSLAGLGTLVLLVCWREHRRNRIAIAATCILALDLALAHRNANPAAPVDLYRQRPSVLRAFEATTAPRVYSYDYAPPGVARQKLGMEHAHLLSRLPAGWQPGPSVALGMQMALCPQTPGRWGLRQGFDVDYRGLLPTRAAQLASFVRLVEDEPSALVHLLRIASVTHVVAMHPVGGGLLRPVASELGLFPRPSVVLAVPDPLPRARLVTGVRVVDGVEALSALIAPEGSSETTVVLPRGTDRVPIPSFVGRATVTSESSDALDLVVDASHDSFLVLADSFDPGWRAWLDGTPVEVLRADVAFRAVAVPAGRHTVGMRYRPPLVLAGLVSSLLTGSLLLAGGLWSLSLGRSAETTATPHA